MSDNKIKIEVWSDIVCPFCYLGKRKLENAIEKLGANDKIEVRYKSFQLDPLFPMDSSISTMEYLTVRKGYHPDQVQVMSDQLTAKGKSYGIHYDFDKARTFNTKNAHRLIKWAESKGKSSVLKDSLMKAYFTEGIDLSETDNLTEVVTKVGLNAIEASELLASDKYNTEVENEIKKARELGIRGVPYFLVNSEKHISGAQEDQVFEKIIESALLQISNTSTDSTEQVCTPEQDCK